MSKFKLNWGWSILIVYATFIVVFLFFFFKSFQEQESNDLVVEDYYKKELAYGDIIAKRQNADTMRTPVQIINDENGINIIFPDYIKEQNISGHIELYKPDNKKLDQLISFNLKNKQQKITKNILISGRWDIILDWKNKNTEYFIKKKLTIK